MKSKKYTIVIVLVTILCYINVAFVMSQTKDLSKSSGISLSNSSTEDTMDAKDVTSKKKGKKGDTKKTLPVSLGIKAGLGFSTFFEDMFGAKPHPVYHDTNTYPNWNSNSTIGFSLLVQVMPEISGEVDILYAVRGGTFRGINPSTQVNHYTYNLNYLVVPVIARYHFVKKSSKFPVDLSGGMGLYIGYLLSQQADIRIIDVGTDNIIVDQKGSVKDLFNPLDTGFLASFLIRIDIITDSLTLEIDTRYYGGFNNVRKDVPQLTYLNSAFEILGGLSFTMDLNSILK